MCRDEEYAEYGLRPLLLRRVLIVELRAIKLVVWQRCDASFDDCKMVKESYVAQ